MPCFFSYVTNDGVSVISFFGEDAPGFVLPPADDGVSGRPAGRTPIPSTQANPAQRCTHHCNNPAEPQPPYCNDSAGPQPPYRNDSAGPQPPHRNNSAEPRTPLCNDPAKPQTPRRTNSAQRHTTPPVHPPSQSFMDFVAAAEERLANVVLPTRLFEPAPDNLDVGNLGLADKSPGRSRRSATNPLASARRELIKDHWTTCQLCSDQLSRCANEDD